MIFVGEILGVEESDGRDMVEFLFGENSKILIDCAFDKFVILDLLSDFLSLGRLEKFRSWEGSPASFFLRSVFGKIVYSIVFIVPEIAFVNKFLVL